MEPPWKSFKVVCVSANKSGTVYTINTIKDTFIEIVLPRPKTIRKVKVHRFNKENILREDEIGTIRINQTRLKQLPPFIGEYDIVNALNYSPGVTKGTEGNNGLFIRGGSPDQNLITLDGALIYNPNHFFGMFSPFSSDAVSHISMQKSGFGAEIGGRLSSHLAIDLKEGDRYRHKHTFSISPIALTASSYGPISSPKTTYLVSFRRSYFDLLITPLISSNTSTAFYFYDFNAKLTHQFNPKNKISLSLFSFQDKAFNKSRFESESPLKEDITETNEQSLSWKDNLFLINYKGQLRKNIFLHSDVYYSSFIYKNDLSYTKQVDSFGRRTENFSSRYDFKSNVATVSSNHKLTWWFSRTMKLKLGLGYFYHSFLPSSKQFTTQSTASLSQRVFNLKDPDIFANETYVFAENQIQVSPKLQVNAGLRYSSYHTTRVNFFNPQPRLSARINIADNWYLKPSLTQTVQYLHFATNNTIGLPIDLWLPATKNLKPETAQQGGLQLEYFGKKINLGAEAYYKKMANLIDYAEGIEYLGLSDLWENKFVQGHGETYGVDFLLEKKMGNTTGWLSYTWSINNRQFDSINGGKTYPFKYDRRHNFSLAIRHKVKKGVEFYGSWVYGSGSAVTLPIGRYPAVGPNLLPNQDIFVYGERNSHRMPDYHRLDAGFKFTKIKPRYTRIWNFSIYNVYNRQNPFYITPGTDDQGDRAFIQVSLLPFIPSVSYRIEIH